MDDLSREQLAPTEEITLEELRVAARISGAEVIKGEYVLYHISIATGTSSGLCWKVARRFREFESLHSTLANKFGADKLPQLPKNSLRRNLDPEYVRKRKIELDRYLSDLVLDPQVVTSEPLAAFLLQNIQDIVRSNVEALRRCAKRDAQVKELERDALKAAADRRAYDRERDDHAKVVADLQVQVMQAEESVAVANNEITMLHVAWEGKFADAVAYARELKTENKTALKFVKDLDIAVRRLKLEKKVLVKEVKENRARLAALGALGHVGLDSPNLTGSGADDCSTVTSGSVTPSGHLQQSPSLQASPTSARHHLMQHGSGWSAQTPPLLASPPPENESEIADHQLVEPDLTPLTLDSQHAGAAAATAAHRHAHHAGADPHTEPMSAQQIAAIIATVNGRSTEKDADDADNNAEATGTPNEAPSTAAVTD